MVINTNIHATASARHLGASNSMLGKSLARLSSGNKIVNPSDDAAGLSVSEKMEAQRVRVNASYTNVQNAISFVQTSDGFLKNMSKILTRMSELSMLAKDVTKNADDISLYNEEFTALKNQLRSTIGGDYIGGSVSALGTYNEISLFNSATSLNITIGEGPGQTMSIGGINLTGSETAMYALIQTETQGTSVAVSNDSTRELVIEAINELATERARLGASQSRLEVASATLQVQSENLEAAISRIRDVDIAEETTKYARYQILVQSGTAMLAQANQLPQSVLRLLG